MYVAMNRFKVAPGSEAAFETQWMTRESFLHRLPGFLSFHLLKGPERLGEEAGDYRLYSSYTLWASEGDFIGWTQSEEFRLSHTRTGRGEVSYLGHPQFEGFHVLQTMGPQAAALDATLDAAE